MTIHEIKKTDQMRRKRNLILQTEDVTIYDDDLIGYIPNNTRVGGFITAVNNHNSAERWKEWKWYRHTDGTMFNDKDYVIDMLLGFVGDLHIKDSL